MTVKKLKTIYVNHPVTKQLKKELTENGFKIIDSKFSAEGDDIYVPKKPLTKRTRRTKK